MTPSGQDNYVDKMMVVVRLRHKTVNKLLKDEGLQYAMKYLLMTIGMASLCIWSSS